MDKPFEAYRGKEPYVFICYAHADAAVVYPELEFLRANGVNVWYDEGISAGTVWRRELANSIQGAARFVYYISDASLESEHCNREIEYALDKNIEVLPIYLDETTLTPELELGLNRVQALHRRNDLSYQQKVLAALGQSPAAGSEAAEPKRRKKALPWYAVLVAVLLLVAVTAGIWELPKSEVDSETSTEEEPVQAEDLPLDSIAVLPFDDLSPDGSQAWLVNAMADSLIGSLSRIEALRIPGRTSTSGMKNQGATIQAIGEKLGVGTIVEGSLLRADDKLIINARWLRVQDETNLWSARYEKNYEDVFEVQQEIAVDIAEAIRTELGIKDAYEFLMQARYKPTDPRAWEYHRKAHDFWSTQDFGRGAEVRDYCLRIIEIDPQYAPGHSCLAASYFYTDPGRAVVEAEKALELDPHDGMAVWVTAHYQMNTLQFAGLEERLVGALRANPRHAWISQVYGTFLRYQGRHAELLAETRRYSAMEPLFAEAQASFARSHVLNGRYREGLRLYEIADALLPLRGWHPSYVAIAHYQLGEIEEALEARVRAAPEIPEQAIRAAWREGGWPASSLFIAENSRYPSCFPQLLGYAGERERMYACIEEELKRPHARTLIWIEEKFGFEDYWDEPEFQSVLQRIRKITSGTE